VVVDEDGNSKPSTGITNSRTTETAQKWLAYPKTLRLSTRVKSRPSAIVDGGSQQAPPPRDTYYNRSSRSSPLPTFVFSLKDGIDYVAERFVNEAVLPLFRRLHSERQNWNLTLINICVTNMVPTGNDDGRIGGGRDISRMFKTQDAKLKEFTVYDNDDLPALPAFTAKPSSSNDNSTTTVVAVGIQGPTETAKSVIVTDDATHGHPMEDGEADDMVAVWDDDDDDGGESRRCPECGQRIPEFAMSAHLRFHALGGA